MYDGARSPLRPQLWVSKLLVQRLQCLRVEFTELSYGSTMPIFVKYSGSVEMKKIRYTLKFDQAMFIYIYSGPVFENVEISNLYEMP